MVQTHVDSGTNQEAKRIQVLPALYSLTMSDRGRLAVETEKEAIHKLSSVFLGRATVIDLSDSQVYDFEIRYESGRKAIGEIGLLANPAYESAWATLQSRDRQHFVDLPDGYGTWGTHLYGYPNIRRFEIEIPKIIAELLKMGIDQFQVGMHFELRELSQHCESLGIQYLNRHVDHPENQVVYFLDMGQTFFIDPTLNSLVKVIETAFLEGSFQDSWKKLEPHISDEKHLFFKCGSLIPLNHQHALLTSEPEPAIPDITFPPGVTNIWVSSNYVEARSIYWSLNGDKGFF